MKKRIFWCFTLLSVFIVTLTSVLIIFALYKVYENERKQELVNECTYIAEALGKTDLEYLAAIGKNSPNRITLISPDGTVIFDNFVNTVVLGNHLNRPEISEALKNGTGEATRLSDTLGENTYYYALRLDNGNCLRLAITTKSIFGIIKNTAGLITAVLFFSAVVAVITAKALTKAVLSPINKINLDDPLANNTYDELSSLLLRIKKQNDRINEQISALQAKQNELNTIAGSMNEALVIFGVNKHVLYSNSSAHELFGNNCINNIGYLELCRDAVYIQTVESAFDGKPAMDKISSNGKVYQISVNPVKGDKTYAAVLFASDVTEKEQNEKMRREFSANVSHELKTPLTSILGYAEIMLNGIAKQADYPRFIEQIYRESKRLLTLVEDIIKLSQLDEKGIQNEFSVVDLYLIAEKAVDELKGKAELNNIAVSVTGVNCPVMGIEGTLYEMIHNLCDNAIIYNKTGGSVAVSVLKIDKRVILSVKDTGIGIAPEHQSRIFERFYRVDKSRSKDTGGTGLGLSIVKHGALLHNAVINLDSRQGEGTTVMIEFQAADV